jgi:hypothetical protein
LFARRCSTFVREPALVARIRERYEGTNGMPQQRAAHPRHTTRYRRAARDTAARQAHAQQSREWRRSIADAEFDELTRTLFLRALESLGDVAKAASKVGFTSHVVYGRMRWDEEFAGMVEATLSEACRGGELCGRPGGYKNGGRCGECRAAHHGRSRTVK